jgi:ribosomal protein L15E
MYDSHVDCPECGGKTYEYYENVLVDENDTEMIYEGKINYICRNQKCGYRWDV